MAEPPDRRGSISRPVVIALAISLAVLGLIAMLVWQPLISSLHLVPAPVPTRAPPAPAADMRPAFARGVRAP